MEITRREALKLGMFGGAALFFPLQRAAVGRSDRPLRRLPQPFEEVLRRPPVLRPVRRTPTTDFYEITQRSARVEVLPGRETEIWGYNSLFPGPTIMARRGRRVVVRHTNRLSRPTSVHLHGAYVDGDNDGHPADLVQPGTSRTYVYPNDQNARFMWYHDHAEHLTATNVYHGLAGIYLLEDDFEDDLPLPKGQFDVPLVIGDRLFTEGGLMRRPVTVRSLPITMAERYEIIVDFSEYPVDLGANHNRIRVLLRWPRVPVVGRAGAFAHRFPIHCHNIEHEDHDMMVQFEVGARA